MGIERDESGSGRALRRKGLAVMALGVLLLAACGDDESGDSDDSEATSSTVGLGPEDEATGEPVRIGMASDGATDAFDNTDELRAAEATAEYWNTHRGGLGGQPVEVVTCETGADPAGAADCANQFVEEDVVAVALGQSGVAPALWEPLHAAGVPTFWFQAGGEISEDDESSFNVFNPEVTLFGLPLSVAESEEADRVAFVVIDVPQALETLERGADTFTEAAGVEYEIVKIAPGTADMTSQMQQVADSGAGVVQVTGNDAFCIAAFNGLNAAGYDGAVTAVSQCITDATREGVAGDVLEGTYVMSTVSMDGDDPTYQLYVEAMEAYGEDVQDVPNTITMSGYVAMAGLLTGLDEISGDITHETVIETMKSMPEAELPVGGGMTYQCGGSASDEYPAVCTNESLRTQLDAEGEPATYEVVDGNQYLPEE